MALPLDAFKPNDDEYSTLQRAERALIRECMAEQGFDWNPPLDLGSPHGDLDDRRYRYVIDRDVAAEWGYHVPPRNDALDASPEDYAVTAAEDAALVGDWLGDDPDGCVGEAHDQLIGGMEFLEAGGLNLPYLLSEIGSESFNRSEADPRVVAARDEWVACMAEGGYEIRDPIDYLPADITLSIDSSAPSAGEVEMAIRDVECQSRTGVVATYLAVESEIQDELIEEHAEELAQISEEYDELFRRAAELIQGE